MSKFTKTLTLVWKLKLEVTGAQPGFFCGGIDLSVPSINTSRAT